jgi:hypothetical protein
MGTFLKAHARYEFFLTQPFDAVETFEPRQTSPVPVLAGVVSRKLQRVFERGISQARICLALPEASVLTP